MTIKDFIKSKVDMKILTKIKIFFYLVIGLFCFFGVLFVKNFFYNEVKEVKCEKKDENVLEKSKNLRDLENCQSELFLVKNANEKLKIIPDRRKDVIKLLILMREIEKKIGIEKDFSNDCVNLFSIGQRIPEVQDFILKYKDEMFSKMCQVSTNDEIISLIMPFQVKIIDQQYKDKNKDNNFIKQVFEGTKYHISRLFVKSRLEQSEIEKKVLNRQYNDALNLLEAMKLEKNNEYDKLYNAINGIYNLQYLIENVYKIINNVNDIK